MSERNPAEEGIQAAKADNRRARELANDTEAGELTLAVAQARWDRNQATGGALGITGPRPTAKREKNTKLAASGSANAINRAIGHLEAAISELAEAGARAEAAGSSLDTNQEEVAHAHTVELLDEPRDGLIQALRELRDRRAARAGFSFDDE